MNNNNPNAADAPVPPEGTEHAADQAAKAQQPPPAETSTLDNVGSAIIDVASIASDIFSIFE